MIACACAASCACSGPLHDCNLLARPIRVVHGCRPGAQRLLAGLVVALALIPEAIGFSIISGVDPRVGLYASVAIAIVISLAGGRPA
jgi:SulP family sulfate permease